MSTVLWCPSSGAAAVSPTPDAGVWTAHINSVSRPLNFTRGNTALTTLTYTPDAADHLVAGTTMVAQFVSQILPPQAVAGQQIGWGTEMSEPVATNNLTAMLRLYGCNVAGTSNLGTFLAGTAGGTEFGTTLTGQTRIQAGSAVTFNEPWRLVAEWGCSGTPTTSASVDGHNCSMVFGDPFANGAMTLIQDQDTGNGPAMIVFSEDICALFRGHAAYGIGL